MNIFNKISTTLNDIKNGYDIANNAVVLSLAKAWIGIGTFRPASTEGKGHMNPILPNHSNSRRKDIDRFDYNNLWSVQIGDYFMPLSQTFRLRAKKRLNVSSLVDGIDIIQQTRREAKTIECTLILTVRDNQNNLQIVEQGKREATKLADFLRNFYDSDTVLKINNSEINDTFGVNYVFMSEYDFNPQVGKLTYVFNFTLTEVIYGDNVLTFDKRQVSDDQTTQRSLTD